MESNKKYLENRLCNDLMNIPKIRKCSICHKPGNKRIHKHSDVEIIFYEMIQQIEKQDPKGQGKQNRKNSI